MASCNCAAPACGLEGGQLLGAQNPALRLLRKHRLFLPNPKLSLSKRVKQKGKDVVKTEDASAATVPSDIQMGALP